MQFVSATRKSGFVVSSLIAAIILMALSAGADAQDNKSPAPKTDIEAAMAQTGAVLMQESSSVGSISEADSKFALSVHAYKVRNVATQKESSGLEISVTPDGVKSYRAYVDYSELPGLLSALEHLQKTDSKAARMESIIAKYRSKGGFEVSAWGFAGGTLVASFHAGGDYADIVFGLDKLAAFSKLLVRGRDIIDGSKK